MKTYGTHIEYLPVNQAWALMWYNQVLGIYNNKQDAFWERAILIRDAAQAEAEAERIDKENES